MQIALDTAGISYGWKAHMQIASDTGAYMHIVWLENLRASCIRYGRHITPADRNSGGMEVAR